MKSDVSVVLCLSSDVLLCADLIYLNYIRKLIL